MAKKNMPIQENAKPIQSLSPEIVGQLVENQSKELELRAQELSLRKQQDNNGFEFSKKALDAQVTDRKLQRDHNKHSQRNQYFLISFLALTIVFVIIIALYLNKEVIATEIIKAVVFILAGGIGGYGLSSKKDSDKNNEEKPQ